MLNSDGKSLKTQIGYIAGSLCKSNCLRYCPECAKSEVNRFGEAYFHRLHQIQGVLVCPIHKVYLNNYNLGRNDISRLRYLVLHYDQLIQGRRALNICSDENLVLIALGFSYLLNNYLNEYSQNDMHQLYIRALEDRGMLTCKGYIKQTQIYEEFVDYFGNELL